MDFSFFADNNFPVKTKEIDILNVILIVVSLTMAFNIPFELFLFSYSVLGPLHYLTEINWLKEKKYFIKETKWIGLFLLLAFLLTLPVLMKFDFLADFYAIPSVKKVTDFLTNSADEIIMIGLLLAIGLIYFKNKLHLALFLIPSIALGLLALHHCPNFALALSIFVPTLIHVYLFTLLFMIYGTINTKSTPGIIAIVLLVLTPFIIAASKINPTDYIPLKESTISSFNMTSFGALNFGVSKFLFHKVGTDFNFLSSMGIKIQIFIAFAYTYHYLNWFSKTSIIGWGKSISKRKIITILCIWILSIALYLYNFKVGFLTLLFLSLIHVFLEFPLNMTSIKGIAMKMKSR